MDLDDPREMLKRAATCSRLAEQTDDPIEALKLRQIAEEYEAKARGLLPSPSGPDPKADPSAHQRALNVLREFELARAGLLGKTVILSDGKAGSVEMVRLDELHGLRVTVSGHDGDWPISTVKFSDKV
jgi:hypothetical protein